MKKWNDNFLPKEAILYHDDRVLVINKPAGAPSQDDQSKDPSILNIYQEYLGQDLYLINRLDRPVGGCILLAKSKEAATTFSAKGYVSKTYHALVKKQDIPSEATIDPLS